MDLFLARKEVIEFLEYHKEEYGNSAVDPLSKEARGDDVQSISPRTTKYSAMFHGTSELDDTLNSIVKIAESIRGLHSIFRTFDSIWTRLKGEIDIEDCFCLCTLKQGLPQAYEFIVLNEHDIISTNHLDSQHDAKKNRIEMLKNIWDDYDFGRKSDDAWKIFIYLFPYIENQARTGSKKKAKSVRSNYPINYFAKFKNSFFDQQQSDRYYEDQVDRLKCVSSHQDEKSVTEILSMFDSIDEEHSAVVIDCLIYFSEKILTNDEVLYIAKVYMTHLAKNAKGKKLIENFNFRPKLFFGIHELYYSIGENPNAEEAHRQWLNEVLEVAVSESLSFSNSIFYWFRSYREPKYAKSDVIRNRSLYSDLITGKYLGNDEEFIRALGNEDIWVLTHLLVHFGSDEFKDAPFGPNLEEFITFILRMIKKTPNAVGAQFLMLVTKFEHDVFGEGGFLVIDKNAITKLFDNVRNDLKGYVLTIDVNKTIADENQKEMLKVFQNKLIHEEIDFIGSN